ncbi:MAG TPA: glycosyltransferase [Jatrophihabitantaceae bacterium]
MRIVQLANFHSPTSGGLRVAVDTLRAGYLDASHACMLVAPGPVDEIDGTVRRLRAPRLPNRSGYRVILRRKAVLALLDELRPDVVEVHDKLLQQWVWAWSRARKVPVVAMSHERLTRSLPMLIPFAPDRVLRPATEALARRTETRCDLLVTCSRFAAAEFGQRALVVPLGVDLETFRPPSHREQGRRLRLVVVGRLSAEKRPDLAVETLRALRADGVDSELTVVGDGPMRQALARLASDLPVQFAGHLRDRVAVAAALGTADVALVCAPAETFGLAALEALACGTPIVAVAGAAPAEIVAAHPEAGTSAGPDPAAFARAVARLSGTPHRRDAARACAEAYPWSATVATMLGVHAAVVRRADATIRATG